MIDLTPNGPNLEKNIEFASKKGLVLPTFDELKNPNAVDAEILENLKNVELDDDSLLNLFRLNWKNASSKNTYLRGNPNYFEIPSEISGVAARIVGLVGSTFPTGSHKSGAAYGCIVPEIVSGRFLLDGHSAAWPSTGNFCRGGVFISELLGCNGIAILPEEMSRERFDWLAKYSCEVIKTPGGESSVKEIYDECKKLKSERKDVTIFNQFEEFGNYLWHYNVTGNAISELAENLNIFGKNIKGFVSASGSAGTLAAGDYLKTQYPKMKICAVESAECSTMMNNGYGEHAIEGIGDKHIPWIHNVKNTDFVAAVAGEDCLRLLRLFNEEAGRELLSEICGEGFISDNSNNPDLDRLGLLGISGICNLIASIKYAKYFELSGDDVVFTVFTDSVKMYQSRLGEMTAEFGEYNEKSAMIDFHGVLNCVKLDNVLELDHYSKKRIHNLKYFTWIEQQGKDVDELDAQWHDDGYWEDAVSASASLDEAIRNFNAQTAAMK